MPRAIPASADVSASPAAARSARLICSQLRSTPSASVCSSLPNTCGWRRTILSLIAAATSSKPNRSEEHTSELQSLMRTSYAVFCLKKKKTNKHYKHKTIHHHIHRHIASLHLN